MNEKIREWTIDILAMFGIVFFLTLIHELIHVIQGFGPNIAMCIGLTNINRIGFVVNGDNYDLFTEPIAYIATIIIAIVIFLIIGGKKK